MIDAEQNVFEVLGLPLIFNLTEPTIESAYFQRAAEVHPDVANSDDSETLSARLNTARQRILNPESRAIELLRAVASDKVCMDNSLPEHFLSEIMVARMDMEMAVSSGDPHDIDTWRQWADDQRSDFLRAVSNLFDRLDTTEDAHARDALSLDIKRTLNAWRYIERMRTQLDDRSDPSR